MEKEQRKGFVLSLCFWFLCILFPWLLLQVSWGNGVPRSRAIEASKDFFFRRISGQGKKEERRSGGSLDILLRGDDRERMMATGFACNTGVYSKHCVADAPLLIDTTTMTVTVQSPLPSSIEETVIRPYARQEDQVLMQRITPVKISAGNFSQPLCQHNHKFPAVVFSTSGFVGNVFHEINEIIIPLFITTRRLNSDVVFIVEDYNQAFMKKYSAVLAALTSSEIINRESNRTVHCFPGGVIGLKFHNHLSIDPGDVPTGLSIVDFRNFLRRSLNLRFNLVSQISQPRLLLLSRRSTRRILNEEQLVTMMRELGFEVIVIHRSKTISNLKVFSRIVNSCSVFVGAHGAGLTNEVFLPDGAVMVQLDLIGLNWAAAAYYGDPARAMRVHYLKYEIRPEESSLWKVFAARNSTVFSNPTEAFSSSVGREVYLNGQNVRVDVQRFRETMVEAMSLVRDSPL